MRVAPSIELSSETRLALEKLSRRCTTAVRVALRGRIVLLAADVDPPRSQPAAKLLLLKKIQLKENIASYCQQRFHAQLIGRYLPVRGS